MLDRMVSVKGRYLTDSRISEIVLFYLFIYLSLQLLLKRFLSFSRYSDEVVLSPEVLHHSDHPALRDRLLLFNFELQWFS